MKQNPKNTTQRPMTPEERQAYRRQRRRRRRIIQTVIILSIILLLALVVTLVVLHAVGVSASKKGETTSFLAVKAIEVVGESRYTDQELIQTSGIYVGQSLLAINKVQAHDALLKAHPYLARVEVSNSTFDTVRITVEETPVMGAVALEEGWMVLGRNNHALERLEERPTDMLCLMGAGLAGEKIGKPLLDERSLGTCTALVDAAAAYNLTGLSAIDMTEKTNIVIWWKGQVEIILGNESNVKTQIKALSDLLPTFIHNNGEDATGRLDMSSYADDDNSNDKAIFTPSELLPSTQEEEDAEGDTAEPAEGDTL